jgi:nicotinamidase-related amidase
MSTKNYQLDERSAVIFIEFQNEWLDEKGFLRTNLIKDETYFNTAIKQAKELRDISRKNNTTVFHVTLSPDNAYKIFGTGQFGLRAVIPKVATWQNEMKDIHPDFTPLKNEVVIKERTGASAFAGSMLDSVLRNNQIDTIYLAGFASHVCVESTLREAHDKGYNCHIVTDATAAFTKQQQAYFEQEIIHHFGNGLTTFDIASNN